MQQVLLTREGTGYTALMTGWRPVMTMMVLLNNLFLEMYETISRKYI
jgi:hypothetical protein